MYATVHGGIENRIIRHGAESRSGYSWSVSDLRPLVPRARISNVD